MAFLDFAPSGRASVKRLREFAEISDSHLEYAEWLINSWDDCELDDFNGIEEIDIEVHLLDVFKEEVNALDKDYTLKVGYAAYYSAIYEAFGKMSAKKFYRTHQHLYES